MDWFQSGTGYPVPAERRTGALLFGRGQPIRKDGAKAVKLWITGREVDQGHEAGAVPVYSF